MGSDEALTGLQLAFDEMLRRADTSDDGAKQVLQDAGFYFGVALANLVKTYEIPHEIVGGLPDKESAVFMKATRDALHSYIPDSLQVDVQLRVGRLPEEQYALGGCYLVFEHLFSRPKLALSLI